MLFSHSFKRQGNGVRKRRGNMSSAKWKRATMGLFPASEQKNDEDLSKKKTNPRCYRNGNVLLNSFSHCYTTLKIYSTLLQWSNSENNSERSLFIPNLSLVMHFLSSLTLLLAERSVHIWVCLTSDWKFSLLISR